MALTDITIGSTDYKSYASVVEADDFLLTDPRYSGAWGDLENDTKSIYLVYATRQIDRHSFNGVKTSPSQSTQFPRDGDSDVPEAIVQATILIAGSFAVTPPVSSPEVPPNLKSFKADVIEFEFFANAASGGGLMLNQDVEDLLAPFISGSGLISLPGPRVAQEPRPMRYRKNILA